MKVFVYFNLHKKVWSIKALEGERKGRVIGHAECVFLENIEPKVSEAGRQRVLREKRKNVHAGIVGTLKWVDRNCNLREHYTDCDAYLLATCSTPVTYNPYKFRNFVLKGQHNAELLRADCALLHASDRSVLVGGWACTITKKQAA